MCPPTLRVRGRDFVAILGKRSDFLNKILFEMNGEKVSASELRQKCPSAQGSGGVSGDTPERVWDDVRPTTVVRGNTIEAARTRGHERGLCRELSHSSLVGRRVRVEVAVVDDAGEAETRVVACSCVGSRGTGEGAVGLSSAVDRAEGECARGVGCVPILATVKIGRLRG